jgi:hypothetical protein
VQEHRSSVELLSIVWYESNIVRNGATVVSSHSHLHQLSTSTSSLVALDEFQFELLLTRRTSAIENELSTKIYVCERIPSSF